MLTNTNEELLYLKEKLREHDKNVTLEKSKTEELEKKRIHRNELEKILEKERLDVEKLEGLNLSAMLSTLLGNKYEKIDKEKEEYLVAKLKYEDSSNKIAQLEKEVNILRGVIVDNGDLHRKYEALIREKESLIIAEGGNQGIRLKNLMIKMDEIQIDIKEISEAINAGQTTLDVLGEIRDSLRSAQNWGTWDMLGGGLLATVAKHSAIEKANKIADDLHYHLRSFKKELADVNEFTDIQVNLSSFESFADFFFDGIFVDWFVQTKINTSLDNVNNTIDKIEEIIADLDQSMISLETNFKNEEEESKRMLEL